jgi:hypothetical protein
MRNREFQYSFFKEQACRWLCTIALLSSTSYGFMRMVMDTDEKSLGLPALLVTTENYQTNAPMEVSLVLPTGNVKEITELPEETVVIQVLDGDTLVTWDGHSENHVLTDLSSAESVPAENDFTSNFEDKFGQVDRVFSAENAYLEKKAFVVSWQSATESGSWEVPIPENISRYQHPSIIQPSEFSRDGSILGITSWLRADDGSESLDLVFLNREGKRAHVVFDPNQIHNFNLSAQAISPDNKYGVVMAGEDEGRQQVATWKFDWENEEQSIVYFPMLEQWEYLHGIGWFENKYVYEVISTDPSKTTKTRLAIADPVTQTFEFSDEYEGNAVFLGYENAARPLLRIIERDGRNDVKRNRVVELWEDGSLHDLKYDLDQLNSSQRQISRVIATELPERKQSKAKDIGMAIAGVLSGLGWVRKFRTGRFLG